LWSYLFIHGDVIIPYCYMWLAHNPEDEDEVSLVVYVNFIAACQSALHHSFALEVISLTYGHDRTGTASWDAAPHLVGCAGRRHFCIVFICIHEVH
jgi:hypothetical protein